MLKERFREIFSAHGFCDARIDFLWGSYRRVLNEEVAHSVAKLLAPISKEIA